MRSKSQTKKREIIDFVNEYKQMNNGSSPTKEVIGKEVKMAKSTVCEYLKEMAAEGAIEYDGRSIGTVMTERYNSSMASAQLVGRITCGPVEEQVQEIKSMFMLPSEIFGKGDFFVLEAEGDSMIGAGIQSGDYVVIKKNAQPKIGDVVAAYDGNGGTTLKTFSYDKKRKVNYLHPENPEYDDIYLDEIIVQGVAERYIGRVEPGKIKI